MAGRRPDPSPWTRSPVRAEHVFDPGLASGQWEVGNRKVIEIPARPADPSNLPPLSPTLFDGNMQGAKLSRT